MKVRFYIWLSILVLAGSITFYKVYLPQTQVTSIMAIQVFAGDDRNLCPGATLDLASLNAYISGDVSDGYWFTSGDGRFLPGFTTNKRFSSAVSYVPGVLDNANGGVTLTLVSDDPDLDPITGTNGPLVQVSDQVRISFPPPPSLVCNTNLQVSLDFDCTIRLDASALVVNPRQPYGDYFVEMYDKNQILIPGSLLTKAHVKQNITFKVGHNCSSHFCWGSLSVSDYYPPIFECRNDTLSCIEDPSPLEIGLPIPITAVVDSFKNGKFYISNWDACGQVQLTYTDEIEKLNCSIPVYDRIITRRWHAKDESQNLSTCIQTIHLRKASLAEIVFPPSFDDVLYPSFDCLDTFPTFPNRHPSTDTTGMPTGGGCQNIGIVMTDIRFETCGAGYKLARSWFVIDWCTQESITRNQIILVKDKRPPTFICPEDLTMGTGFYTCTTGLEVLPLPDSIQDCSPYQILVQLTNQAGQNLNNYLFYSNQKYHINNVPIGNYIIKYILIDECQNNSQCEVNLTVVDIAPPITVCDKTTVISVDHLGKARLFATSLDDGSWDNCGILKYEIKRKQDTCGFPLQWGPYADFCCLDIGKIHHVSMQVTDIHGLVNTCHVEVEVDDKLKPVITCPTNVTISCDYAYDPNNLNEFGTVVTNPSDRKPIIIFDRINNGVVGQDGIATDNCNIRIEKRHQVNVQCYKGTILRTFTAIDPGNFRDSCTQFITIKNPDLLDYDDIIWPAHYSGNGCKIADVDTSVSGAPRYKNTSCTSIASWYEDQPFFMADSSCVKIFRNWWVIDWCQFNETTLEGRWGPYTQIIKINNYIAPWIVSGCTDTLICNFEENCGSTLARFSATGMDDCTPVSALSWQYHFDVNNDGIYNYTGFGNTVDLTIPIGIHSMKWTLRDQCGNTTECTQKVEVKDCKKPTPYCISQVSMTLDELSQKAEIWAVDLDLGSFDNCTPQDKLIFSFSTDTLDKVIYLGCEHLPNGRENEVPLNLYITDLVGNQQYCSVTVLLTDNSDVCPDNGITGDIEGKIATTTGYSPEGIQVQFRVFDRTEHSTVHANAQGKYIIPQVSDEFLFVLKPHLNTHVSKGVSTLDIVLIQRHIIGTKVFDNPYQFIAADVNRSKNLNSIDLVELRKIVLGTKSEFPNQTPSWVFVDPNESFPFGPFGQKYADTITTRSPSPDNDFVAIKIGDINLSFENDLLNGSTENRTISQNFVAVKDNHEIIFQTEKAVTLDGFQMAILIPKDGNISSFTLSKMIEKNGFHLDHAILPYDDQHFLLKVLAYTDYPLYLEAGVPLFKISDKETFSEESLSWEIQNSETEIYLSEKAHPLGLIWREKTSTSTQENIFTLLANPVKDIIQLAYHNIPHREMNGKLFDISGKLVFDFLQNVDVHSDGNIEMNLPSSMRPGLYLLMLNSGDLNQSFSIVKIE